MHLQTVLIKDYNSIICTPFYEKGPIWQFRAPKIK